jgi:hypothetical protein
MMQVVARRLQRTASPQHATSDRHHGVEDDQTQNPHDADRVYTARWSLRDGYGAPDDDESEKQAACIAEKYESTTQRPRYVVHEQERVQQDQKKRGLHEHRAHSSLQSH